MNYGDLFLKSWFDLYNPHFVGLSSILFSTVCGAIVGYERQKKNKPAGVKTIILVCLGATIFSQISLIMSIETGDPARIAAQVVSGVGFLGAGAVMRGDGNVSGLTTAATIWIAAAIGLVSGSGYPLPALGLSTFVYFILRTISLIEQKTGVANKFSKVALLYQSNKGKTDILIMDILGGFGIEEEDFNLQKNEDGTSLVRFKYLESERFHNNFLIQFAQMDEVISIETT